MSHVSQGTPVKTLIIYHGKCPDGFGACWVLRKAFIKQGIPEHKIITYAASYGTEPPWEMVADAERVVIADFCYETEHLYRLRHDTNDNLVILDHHQTALGWCMEAFSAIPGGVHTDGCTPGCLGALGPGMTTPRPHVVVDSTGNRSGIGLAIAATQIRGVHYWADHIEANDLWKHDDIATKPIVAAVTSYPQDFEVWDMINDMDDDLYREGCAIERYRSRIITEALDLARKEVVLGHENIWVFPTATYTIASETAGILAERDPKRFAAYYVDLPDNERRWGLRSAESGMDVAVLAQTRGGGGHKHAAGFQVPR